MARFYGQRPSALLKGTEEDLKLDMAIYRQAYALQAQAAAKAPQR